MSKLLTFLPVLNSIAESGEEVSHFNVMMRNARNCERYHLDAPITEQRSGANGRKSITDNRYPIIKSDSVTINKRLLSYGNNDVDMFRIKVNDKGAYMIDIILKPEKEE